MGSTWGNTIKISIFGESHGTGIGVVIDGFPSGVMYDEAFVLREMERRAPGRNKQSTARKEPDRPEIQSGIYNGKTTGTPICAVIRNTNQRSNDYAELAAQPRPGHADYTGMLRYDSCNDPRGGGHFSGRLTAPLVFAGALCKLWLKEQGVTVGSHIQSIAQIQDMPFDDVEVTAEQLDALRNAEYPVNNPRALEAMLAAIEEARGGAGFGRRRHRVRSCRAPRRYRQPDARQRGEPSVLYPVRRARCQGRGVRRRLCLRCSARLARERPVL